MDFLRAEEISRKEQTGTVLHKISFTIEQHKKIAIIGETGSGKSTLVKIISGYAQPDTGRVFYQGEKVWGPNEQLIPGHPGIAYLSQHFELRNNYFVHEILDYANKMTELEAEKIFKICQVHHLLKRKTDQLSGGEKQRIALSKLLVGKPSLLLLDEPFSNLDMPHKKIIRIVLQKISDDLGTTCMLISHDPEDFLPWADHIMVLKEGKLIQQGNTTEIYTNPLNEYIAGLTGSYNLITSNSIQLRNKWGLPLGGDDIIIRPEKIKLSEIPYNGIEAIIRKIQFHGHYYSILTETKEQELILRLQECKLNLDNKINLSLQ
jgi:ABC-type branched-subunit amino acid transport system ATPase component